MQFNYGHANNPKLPVSPLMEEHDRYRYESEYRQPKMEIVKEPYHPIRPFEKQDSLTDRIFGETANTKGDPFQFPAQRAELQHRQLDLMLELLGSRHAINYQIRKQIEYEECLVRAKLDEIETRPLGYAREGRFESELIKELHQLQKERQAESIACWRDTSRILSDICESWTEYADQSRKSRLLDDGL